MHWRLHASWLQRRIKQLFLDLHAGGQRIRVACKHHEQAVAQQLDNTALMFRKYLAQQPDQLSRKALSCSIPQPLIRASASNKTSKTTVVMGRCNSHGWVQYSSGLRRAPTRLQARPSQSNLQPVKNMPPYNSR